MRTRRSVLRGAELVEYARPLPDLSVDRGAPELLARLHKHLQSTPHRVLIVAESEGRRESLLELLRDNRIEPPSVASLAEFESGASFAIAVMPLAEGFSGMSRPRPRRSSSSPRPEFRHRADARGASGARSRSATSTR